MWYEDKHMKEVMNRHEELRTDKEVTWLFKKAVRQANNENKEF